MGPTKYFQVSCTIGVALISKVQMTKKQILNPYTSESESTIVCHRKLLYAKQQVHQCECECVCLCSCHVCFVPYAYPEFEI